MTTILLYIPFILGSLVVMLGVLIALGNVLPTASIASAIIAANSYIAIIGQFLPYTMISLIAMLGALLTVEFYIGTYRLIRWIYRKIPGVT